MTSPARRWTGDLITIGAAILMGSSYPFAKEVLAVMSPLLYGASRYLVASLFLFGMLALMRRPLRLARRYWLPMIALSLVGVASFNACWGLAIARTPPGMGSILITSSTAFSAILARLAGRRLPVLGWLGIVVAFAGVVVVVNNSLERVTLSLDRLDGAGLWLLAAFSWALYVERAAPYNLLLGALPVMAWSTLFGSLVLMAVALCFDSFDEFGRLDTRLLGYWLYTGIFPVGVAFLGLTVGFDRLGVRRVMVYMYLIPVAGVGLSASFFGDPLTSARVAGGLIVLLGVVLTRVALDHNPRLR
jgi:O-acetylserine/cysteine efflux transporter